MNALLKRCHSERSEKSLEEAICHSECSEESLEAAIGHSERSEESPPLTRCFRNVSSS
jgi:hypothetical protein